MDMNQKLCWFQNSERLYLTLCTKNNLLINELEGKTETGSSLSHCLSHKATEMEPSELLHNTQFKSIWGLNTIRSDEQNQNSAGYEEHNGWTEGWCDNTVWQTNKYFHTKKMVSKELLAENSAYPNLVSNVSLKSLTKLQTNGIWRSCPSETGKTAKTWHKTRQMVAVEGWVSRNHLEKGKQGESLRYAKLRKNWTENLWQQV